MTGVEITLSEPVEVSTVINDVRFTQPAGRSHHVYRVTRIEEYDTGVVMVHAIRQTVHGTDYRRGHYARGRVYRLGDLAEVAPGVAAGIHMALAR